ncbi:MAG: starch-binding protein [Treponema sp.]|jgi:hypothetical protein|nr:starch-binding protein [Treponema sp.]
MKNKTFFTGILSLALVFGMLLFVGCPTEDDGGNNTGGDNPGGENPGGNTTGTNITLYMAKPASWSNLYAYVWDDSGKEFTATTPGTALTTQSNGFYSYQAQSAEYGYVNVRFSDGGSNATLDILDVEADTYYKSAGTLSGNSSKVKLVAGSTGSFTTPALSGTPASTTITLNWGFIPDADAYVMYDEFVEFDDDDEEIPDSEYWHFQKVLPREQTSFLDNNYGEYLEANCTYAWKLVAVKWNDNFDFSSVLDMEDDDLAVEEFSKNYTVLHDFGELEVTTTEGTLPAPQGLQILTEELAPTSVALMWNPVEEAEYYMVWWWNDGSDGRDEGWYYIEAAFDTQYVDADEEFIFPNSTHKYKVEARCDDKGEGPLYGRYSNDISVTTPSAPAGNIVNTGGPLYATVQKPQIPTPAAPTVTSKASGKVTVTMSNLGTKSRKFEVLQIIGGGANVLGTISGSKATQTKDVSVTAGANVYIAVREVPYGTTSSYLYKTSSYIASSASSSMPVFSFPKLNVSGKLASTSGTGKNTVKTVKVTVTGWPSGAAYHEYVVKASTGTINGTWSGDTYTGTIKTSSKITITVTPYVGGKPGTALKTGKL